MRTAEAIKRDLRTTSDALRKAERRDDFEAELVLSELVDDLLGELNESTASTIYEDE